MSTVLDQLWAVADRLGIPRPVATAIAEHESGLNPTAVGDQGTSFGLFQLHQGGELGSLTPAQAFDPTTNATVALSEVARQRRLHPTADWGTVAADAQRPADPVGYARAVNALLAQGGTTATTGATGGAIPAGFLPSPGGVVGGLLDDLTGGAATGVGKVAGAAGSAVGGVVGDLTGGVVNSVKTVVFTGLFLAAGVALVVLGAVRASGRSSSGSTATVLPVPAAAAAAA